MLPHRYWRARIVSTFGGTTIVQAVAMSESPGGPNLSITGNGSAFGTGTASDAFRGLNIGGSGNWSSSAGTPYYLGWDFGAGIEKAITRLQFQNSAGGAAYDADQVALDYSDNNSDWTQALIGATTGGYNVISAFDYVEPAHASASISLPSFRVLGFFGGGMALTVTTAAANAYGGASAAATSPVPTLSATGHDSAGERAASLALPSMSLLSSAGANSNPTLPSLTTTASGTVTALATAPLTLPSLRLDITGTVAATSAVAITLPSIGSKSYAGALCSITLGGVTTQATGATGGVGRAQIALPLFEATASGAAQNYGSASLTLPPLNINTGARAALSLPGLKLIAIGSANVVATYEAYAINLNHNDPADNDEVTRYTNFPFTKIVRYQGSYFGVAANGLYLLEGTTDDGANIPWSFKTAMTDFKSPFRKTVVSAYFGGRMGPAATIDLHVGEDGATTFNYATVRSDHAQCYRQKFGRGLSAHYYALGAAGAGMLELDNIEFNTQSSTRRI